MREFYCASDLHREGALRNDGRCVRLSICRVPRPNSGNGKAYRKPEIGRTEAHHTGNRWTYLEVKMSKVRVTRPAQFTVSKGESESSIFRLITNKTTGRSGVTIVLKLPCCLSTFMCLNRDSATTNLFYRPYSTTTWVTDISEKSITHCYKWASRL